METNKLSKRIIWPVLLLYLLQTYALSNEIFFAVTIGIVVLIIVLRLKITNMRIPGIKAYIGMLVFISVIGFFKYSFDLVARDIYYEFTNILLIYLGYSLYSKENEDDKIFTTIFIMISIVSVITIITGSIWVMEELRFGTMRLAFSNGIKSIEAFLPIFVIYIFFYKKTIISPRIDKIVIIIWALQAVLNLSRTTMVGVFGGLFLIIFILGMKQKMNIKKMMMALGVFGVIIFLFVMSVKILPESITSTFIAKIEHTFDEVDSDNTYTNLGAASNSWRGYENQCAKEQWKESSVIQQLFGSGNGTLIDIDFLPDAWKGILETQNYQTAITVLHNSYYTLLIKGGLLAVILFSCMFILNIKKGYKYMGRNSNDEDVIVACSLIELCCIMLFDAYVTRGMVQNDAQIAWSIMFGWLNARLLYSTKSCESKKNQEIEGRYCDAE